MVTMGLLSLCMSLFVVSRQFGGNNSVDLMTVRYNRASVCLTLLEECLIISELTPVVSVTYLF